jgi:UDP-glucose 4-epimerase
MNNRNNRETHRRLIGMTGATGFLGDYILRHLQAADRYDIRALSRSPAIFPTAPAGVSWERGDLTSPRDCAAFSENLSVLIHLAHANTPLSSHRDWANDAALNIVPTLNLIEAFRRQERRVDLVFASSGGAIYGHRDNRVPFKESDATYPSSPYGVVKLAIENYLRLASEEGWLRVTLLRIGNPYGRLLPPERRQGLIGVAINQALRGEPVPIYGDPRNVRDYVHLSDVAAMVERCFEPRNPFDVYNVGSGHGASTDEILRLIEKTVGHAVARRQLDETAGTDRLGSWAVLDIGKAERELGWRPQTPLETGIVALCRQSLLG